MSRSIQWTNSSMDNCPTSILLLLISFSCLILKTRQQPGTSITLQVALEFEEILRRRSCSIDLASISESQCTKCCVQCCTLTSQKSNVNSNDTSSYMYLSINITYRNSHLINNDNLSFCRNFDRGTSYYIECTIGGIKPNCRRCGKDLDKPYRTNNIASDSSNEKNTKRKNWLFALVGIICLVVGVIVGACLKSNLKWRPCKGQSKENTSSEAVQNAAYSASSQVVLNADQILEALLRSKSSSNETSNQCNRTTNNAECFDEIDIDGDHYEEIGMIQKRNDIRTHDVNHGHALDDTTKHDYNSLEGNLDENYYKLTKRV